MKKIITLLLLLALSAGCFALGFYAMNANAKSGAITPTMPAQALPTATNTPDTCTVTTGITSGTVNLRACPGSMCGAVLDILTEGERLTILTAGEYVNVTTESGVTGWLNKKYCKGK